MLKRYVAIRTYIRLLGDRNILNLTPTDDQDDEIDALLIVLDECSMLKRYVAIRTYIRLLGDRNILNLTPTDDQDDEIDALLIVLDEYESVTLALQEDATSMLDVRNLFDECMLLHPSASKRLTSNSGIRTRGF
ncbi:hypothetical protein H257_03427 [Aphanomyces astaci]|uniref:Uncharacterized protein n=1 Tax=Aphanomyces astaci TaxID=112090 RepID=W4GWS6_APHAT|nr:hypothetical protein H257_03427 [Aphanomyces astaci]ETV84117.1 hypothetical protein H257_03427 [Aphanomyces astaci]|eukprot:XP_009825809.1 hypothetical protein H257_03427 [Aphanomyces astaci]